MRKHKAHSSALFVCHFKSTPWLSFWGPQQCAPPARAPGVRSPAGSLGLCLFFPKNFLLGFVFGPDTLTCRTTRPLQLRPRNRSPESRAKDGTASGDDSGSWHSAVIVTEDLLEARPSLSPLTPMNDQNNFRNRRIILRMLRGLFMSCIFLSSPREKPGSGRLAEADVT